MDKQPHDKFASPHKRFDRAFFESSDDFTIIGNGEIGGKAHGLLLAKDVLIKTFPSGSFEGITIGIPKLTVITTEYFDDFMNRNHLHDVTLSTLSDEEIALRFQQTDLSPNLVGDLWTLIAKAHTPLAVRSSSLLEDAKFEPFAGVYATKMIPNNQPDTQKKFQVLIEAIKFVYASVFFSQAKQYISATHNRIEDEKMAIIIQAVVGEQYSDRYYPVISGVGRSYNYYAFGRQRPEDGVVNLALGLGKTIVDGSLCWTYCPEMPRVPPPTNSVADLMRQTQNDFWAINMRPSTHYDPTKETEHMCLFGLKDAEYDNTLTQVASTYRPESDSLMVGTYQAGPRVITFAPILDAETLPLNRLVKNTLAACEKSLQNAVEIEFALSHDRENNRYQFGFLQVRPMVVCHTTVDLTAEISQPERCVVRSNKVLGNGLVEGLTHIVYVKPLAFDPAQTRLIASEIAAINQTLQQQQQPYVLIGFGRWGSSDPWLGIPVRWSDICQAKVIVEATLSNMNVDLSQGSHFFHNINGFQVSYFTVSHNDPGIDWNWLDHCQVVSETKYVRHICVSAPLTVKVDGRSQQGVIHK